MARAKIAKFSAVAAWLLALLCLFSGAAQAQTTSYVNSTDGTINGSTSCAAPLVRNFSVADSFTVIDVDIGVYAQHTWRGDLRITLQSPSGTRVRLVNGNTNAINGDNFNVRLNDEGTQTVNTDGNGSNHSTATPPPFQHDFTPNNPLTAFDGQNSAGTWRLEICDLFTSDDDGNFRHAELYLTQQPTNFADLSLNKTVSNTSPASGSQVTYSLTVSSASASTNTANGVQVGDALPTGINFVSATGTGSYNPTSGIWTVGSLAPGASATINIVANVNATPGATVTNRAEIIASSLADIDSTAGNGSTNEDDDDSASFTVQGTRTAGTPPPLICPAGTSRFSWAGRTWSAGSLNNSYALAGFGTINFAITNDGTFLNNATFGGQSPTLQSIVHGGSPGQIQLLQLTDMNNASDEVVTTITLPTAVDGAQFTMADVDYNANQFADRITVTGQYQGATVNPTLTNGVSNYVVGNSAFGDGGADSDSADGNITITFNGPVDTIIIRYGNHDLNLPTNPGQQGVTLRDIDLCDPVANISVTKISQVLNDEVNTENPKAIPGATMRYCILVSNSGSATAENISASDSIPTAVTYVPGSLQTGSGCNSGITGEDEDASGADETDPYGAAFDAAASAKGTITGTANALGPNSNLAIIFNVVID
ncbi:proprotein convertase P-domain-containing protein [Alterisphingorhabdus coralli]|uniref:Proprotein convertase P-domain-containing protein n=1 Tax=Alterisphingorhabdus coralli TaxID=3071408 RepID=A0AA97F611_9SPHN|nr:proprotein convertase P-domain-containing protein [Parasphingorhabdus sp. SCSIO 66989]WOE74994.1 proprotein convertase P-domain-containing protein [Parasphingorhabdus sp. SCSIO 66989]